MTLNSFTAGTKAKASEVDGNFKGINLKEAYSGTGFNANRTATTTGEDSSSYELTAISAANLGDADYLIIEAFVSVRARTVRSSGDSGTGTAAIQIETKEVGGSYSDSLAKTGLISSANLGGDGTHDNTILTTVRWVHTLTAGEKSNGVQVKITGYANTTNTNSVSASGTITNAMTTLSTQASY